ncbi:MAG TPA: BamA/TamA family outer membrane protein [Bryobacteraceae bacterium]|nr:BamA/TamA family outer membrane protein [Bryobacteraceae bacterium]
MRVLLCALLVSTPIWADEAAAENVNSKYTIEAIEVVPSSAAKKVGSQLQSELDTLIGTKFDQDVVDKVSRRLANQLNRKVEHRIEKGVKPEHVKLVFDAPRVFEADADVNKLAYHSKHGITAGVRSDFNAGGLSFAVGMQTDSDQLLERYAGYSLGVSRRIAERVRLGLDYESFHQQWNATTLNALAARPDLPGIYRERYHMAPSISIALLESLTFSAGVDIQHFQTQFPAARYEAANAVTTTLRYRRRWASDASRQEVDAGYCLRAATRSFGSDYVYNRHAMTAEYMAEVRNNIVSASFHLGTIAGEAPLYERFTLGDSRTLRGWSKFDVAPVGGSRVAHASIEYTFHWLGAFYDTGSVWERGEKSDVKHSVGVSVGGREGLFLALAFPLRAGSVQPLFILGMNF